MKSETSSHLDGIGEEDVSRLGEVALGKIKRRLDQFRERKSRGKEREDYLEDRLNFDRSSSDSVRQPSSGVVSQRRGDLVSNGEAVRELELDVDPRRAVLVNR